MQLDGVGAPIDLDRERSPGDRNPHERYAVKRLDFIGLRRPGSPDGRGRQGGHHREATGQEPAARETEIDTSHLESLLHRGQETC